MTFQDGRLGAALLVVVAACSSRGDDEECFIGEVCVDAAGMDAGAAPDAGRDAGVDAGGVDAGRMDAGQPPDAGPLTGDTHFYVLDFIDLGVPDRSDPTICPGFDLDGVVTAPGDLNGCRKLDYTSPAPDSIPGVDNQLGPALAELEPTFGIRANIAAGVRDGSLLILAQVRGVDDFDDDDAVLVDVMYGLLPPGVFAPRLSGDGFEPGQTFDVDARTLDADAMTPLVTLPGRIVAGRLRAGPGMVKLLIPFGATDVELDASETQLRADIGPDALERGVLGGSLSVEDTLAALAAADPPGFEEPLARLLLETEADLDAEGPATCHSISIGIEFAGVRAVRGDAVSP